MHISLVKHAKGRTECTVDIPADARIAAEQKAIAKLGSQVNLKGFRPGKAPVDVLKEQLDPERVVKETVHQLLPEILRKAMEENKLAPIMPPRIEIVTNEPLKLKVLFVESPEVKINGDKIKMEPKTDVKIDEKEKRQFVKQLLWHDRKEKEEERGAQDGDLVKMDLMVEDDKGHKLESASRPDYRVLVGTDEMLPELEKALMGMKKGEKKTVRISLPKEYPTVELQGKKASFHIAVQSVSSVETPEITAEYIKTHFGSDKTPDQFMADIEKMLSERKGRDVAKQRENAFFDKVLKETKTDYAPELVDSEVQAMLENIQQQLTKQNMTMDDWIKSMNKKPEEIAAEMKKSAEDRLTLRFGIQALIKKAEIKVADEEVVKRCEEEKVMAKAQGQNTDDRDYLPDGRRYEQIASEMQVEKLMEKYGV